MRPAVPAGLLETALPQDVDLGPQLRETLGAVGVLPRAEVIAETKEDEGEDDRQECGNCATAGHDTLQVRQLNHLARRGLQLCAPRLGLAFFAWNHETCWDT